MAGRDATCRYVNDFMYFVLQPDRSGAKGTLLFCSGANISRFLPITKGRHRLGQNPVEKGLQLANLGVRHLALSRGATPKAVGGKDCAGIVPTRELWYTEPLLIENVPGSLPEEILAYCPLRLLKHIIEACMLDVRLPEEPMEPTELQKLIESLCREYGG